MREVSENRDALYAAEKDFCLGLYRYAVAHYKPMIERRAGLSIGGIRVKDYEQLHADKMLALELDARSSWLWFLRWPLFHLREKRISGMLRKRLQDNQDRLGACYYWHTIYVSFRNGTQFHQDHVALNVVHEMSHALWERLGGVFYAAKQVNPILRIFVEGFATYAQLIWFADLYPPPTRHVAAGCARWRRRASGPHGEGLKMVERLVKENGVEVLLRLPKEWRKFAVPYIREIASDRTCKKQGLNSKRVH